MLTNAYKKRGKRNNYDWSLPLFQDGRWGSLVSLHHVGWDTFILLNQTPRGSQCSSAIFPTKKKFKLMPTAVKIMATLWKGEGGVLILNFLPSSIIVNTKTNLKIGTLKFNELISGEKYMNCCCSFTAPAHTHISTSMGLSMMDYGNLIMINMVMNALQQELKSRGKNFKKGYTLFLIQCWQRTEDNVGYIKE